MLRLRTLGGLTIEDENGPLAGAIARKRSLALLALVGLSTEQGISRDRVLAYLWPESDTDRARNNLKQTLFQLRRDLHEEVFARGPGTLRLESGAISTDACDFQKALDRGNPTTAVTLYRGPFLDGFYLPGLVEFERWVEGERVRLAQHYADALETLAGTAARLGDRHGATEWWRRLAAHDPLSSRYALGLMRSLAQAGDRNAALEHARSYEELVRSELDVAPEPEVVEYVKQLRGRFARWTGSDAPRVAVQSAAIPSEEMTEPATVVPDPSESDTLLPVIPTVGDEIAAPPLPASGVPLPSAPPQPRRARLVALGLAVIGLGGIWWGDRATNSPPSPDLVAVFPFNYTGPSGPRFLSAGMVDLLSASLDGAGELRSVHPSAYLSQMERVGSEPLDPGRARAWAGRFGAELYVLGDVVACGSRVQISAAMYDRGGNEAVGHSAVEGETAEVFQLVDRLAADLIASRYGEAHQRLTRVAAVTTGSLAAFKSYIEGEYAYRDGRYAEAIEALRNAVRADSTFALAYYRLSDAGDRAGRSDLAQISAERALRFGERLGERERRLIEAQHAWRMGRGEEAERLCRGLVTDYPDDVEAWLLLGEVLVHGNPLRGRSSVEARAALEQVLARDSANGEALIHLARIAYLEGKRQEVDSLVARVLATGQGEDVVETRAFRAFALGDRPGQKRITQLIRADPARVPAVTALDVAVRADDLEGSERFGRLLATDGQPRDLQGYGHRMLAQAALARGQWRKARREVELAARFDSIPALELWSLFAALPFVPLPRPEIVSAREWVRRWDGGTKPPAPFEHTTAHTGLHPYLRLQRLGLLHLRLGDTVAALGEARALGRSADSSTVGRLAHTLAQSIRAHVSAGSNRDAEALALLERAGWEAASSVFASEAYDRYFRAELLERLGREDEALGWYGSIAERAAYELVYLAPAHRRQAEIYERRGKRELAARHYRRFIELWGEADPELQPAVAEARDRLAEVER